MCERGHEGKFIHYPPWKYWLFDTMYHIFIYIINVFSLILFSSRKPCNKGKPRVASDPPTILSSRMASEETLGRRNKEERRGRRKSISENLGTRLNFLTVTQTLDPNWSTSSILRTLLIMSPKVWFTYYKPPIMGPPIMGCL